MNVVIAKKIEIYKNTFTDILVVATA